MYRITFRDANGNAKTVIIFAVDEPTARALFHHDYDGIIIVIEQICPL